MLRGVIWHFLLEIGAKVKSFLRLSHLYCFYKNDLANHLFDPVITKIEIFALLFQHCWLKSTLCSQPCVCVVCGLGVKALKSDNLQYNKLGRWVAGTNDSSDVSSVNFFILSCKILRKNNFISVSFSVFL